MSASTITHSRTLSVAASGTALVMAVFSAFVVNVGDSVRTFHAGVAGEGVGAQRNEPRDSPPLC